MSRASAVAVAVVVALAGCTTYASTTRVNAPGLTDVSTPVAREDATDERYEPAAVPGTQAVIAWLHPSFGGGMIRHGSGLETGLAVSIEKDRDAVGDFAMAYTAWGATVGAGLQINDDPDDAVDEVGAGPIHAEIYYRRFVAMLGAGALVYPDTRDVGVQATVRGPLCHLRARYVQDTGFEVMFAFDLSIPFVFGWSE